MHAFTQQKDNTHEVIISNSVGKVILRLLAEYFTAEELANPSEMEASFKEMLSNVLAEIQSEENKHNHYKGLTNRIELIINQRINQFDSVTLYLKNAQGTYEKTPYVFELRQVLCLTWRALNDSNRFEHHLPDNLSHEGKKKQREEDQQQRIDDFFKTIQQMPGDICHHGIRNQLIALLDRSYQFPDGYIVELLFDVKMLIEKFINQNWLSVYESYIKTNANNFDSLLELQQHMLHFMQHYDATSFLQHLKIWDLCQHNVNEAIIEHGSCPDDVKFHDKFIEIAKNMRFSLPTSHESLWQLGRLIEDIRNFSDDADLPDEKAVLALKTWLKTVLLQDDHMAKRIADVYHTYITHQKIPTYRSVLPIFSSITSNEVENLSQKIVDYLNSFAASVSMIPQRGQFSPGAPLYPPLLDKALEETQKHLQNAIKEFDGHTIPLAEGENFFHLLFSAMKSYAEADRHNKDHYKTDFSRQYRWFISSKLRENILNATTKLVEAFDKNLNKNNERETTVYEINLIFFTALAFPSNQWPKNFAGILNLTLDYVKQKIHDEAQGSIVKKDSYPDELLQKLTLLLKKAQDGSPLPFASHLYLLLPYEAKTILDWSVINEMVDDKTWQDIYQFWQLPINQLVKAAHTITPTQANEFKKISLPDITGQQILKKVATHYGSSLILIPQSERKAVFLKHWQSTWKEKLNKLMPLGDLLNLFYVKDRKEIFYLTKDCLNSQNQTKYFALFHILSFIPINEKAEILYFIFPYFANFYESKKNKRLNPLRRDISHLLECLPENELFNAFIFFQKWWPLCFKTFQDLQRSFRECPFLLTTEVFNSLQQQGILNKFFTAPAHIKDFIKSLPCEVHSLQTRRTALAALLPYCHSLINHDYDLKIILDGFKVKGKERDLREAFRILKPLWRKCIKDIDGFSENIYACDLQLTDEEKRYIKNEPPKQTTISDPSSQSSPLEFELSSLWNDEEKRQSILKQHHLALLAYEDKLNKYYMPRIAADLAAIAAKEASSAATHKQSGKDEMTIEARSSATTKNTAVYDAETLEQNIRDRDQHPVLLKNLTQYCQRHASYPEEWLSWLHENLASKIPDHHETYLDKLTQSTAGLKIFTALLEDTDIFNAIPAEAWCHSDDDASSKMGGECALTRLLLSRPANKMLTIFICQQLEPLLKTSAYGRLIMDRHHSFYFENTSMPTATLHAAVPHLLDEKPHQPDLEENNAMETETRSLANQPIQSSQTKRQREDQTDEGREAKKLPKTQRFIFNNPYKRACLFTTTPSDTSVDNVETTKRVCAFSKR
jgi:uncharacterized protein YeeX (DUF496 family)